VTDPAEFTRRADGAMVVATADTGGDRSGCLVGFHTQCSIEPPRYAVFLSTANHTFEVAGGVDTLGVSILACDQERLARLFGGQTADDGVDKFDHCDWWRHDSGAILVDGASAWLVGSIVDRVETGDHVAFVLHPVDQGAAADRADPLRLADIASINPGHEA